MTGEEEDKAREEREKLTEKLGRVPGVTRFDGYVRFGNYNFHEYYGGVGCEGIWHNALRTVMDKMDRGSGRYKYPGNDRVTIPSNIPIRVLKVGEHLPIVSIDFNDRIELDDAVDALYCSSLKLIVEFRSITGEHFDTDYQFVHIQRERESTFTDEFRSN